MADGSAAVKPLVNYMFQRSGMRREADISRPKKASNMFSKLNPIRDRCRRRCCRTGATAVEFAMAEGAAVAGGSGKAQAVQGRLGNVQATVLTSGVDGAAKSNGS